ncbi:rhamnogalacturonan acetylesterase [Lysobacter sp. K5869]|uniref:rhamnogalacturonan acetylesterase n=1 Tax=Lysobacter sp. K5869 TaxID=2820808 RepID=UPI001C062BDD|nr:rhamnogalacturonan acetylesterase [Lysobacter sp. K5869]QWP75282.1 rhamnogalacturonan acetylesterase [Lysobacter sp. K5869]
MRVAMFLALWWSFAASGAAPTVFLAGDSTLAAKRPEKRPETGWGEALAPAFKPGVRIDNRAMNGRSTRTFVEEGRWAELLAALRPGDHVLIQFGHNDQSCEKPDRYTPAGDFRRNLATFVHQVRERDAVAVLITPVARRRFDAQGHAQPSHGDYPALVRAVAAEERVPLIDLERRSMALFDRAGLTASRRWFLWLAPGEHANYPAGIEDNTHFSSEGARCMAAEVAAGLRELALPLNPWLANDPLPRCDASR